MSVDLTNPPPPKALPVVRHPTDRPNFCCVSIDGNEYWFSYRTCIAFRRRGEHRLVARQNDWGPTTGKHLHYLQVAKEDRLSGEAFELALEAV